MGTCIVCGKSVDGHICDIHEEDVVFEFRGSRPEELTPGRFYRGTVDGFADFGVFVNVGDRVTGLLHRSELDRRPESLGWEVGDAVYVRVTNVRENGDVDLGWSIRQSDEEFRGMLVDDPEGDRQVGAAAREEASDGNGNVVHRPTERGGPTGPTGGEGRASASAGGSAGNAGGSGGSGSSGNAGSAGSTGSTGSAGEAAVEEQDADLARVRIGSLDGHVGERVRIEGEVEDVRQTGGPTVFELHDETGVVDCAAFEEAGVRAYPEVEAGAVVRLDGEVRRRRGELQVETEALVVLEGEDAAAVEERMEDALEARAQPDAVEPLAPDPAVEAVRDELREAAAAIRRAVLDSRPVVVRHSATADGYVAGAAIERATLPLVRDEHARSDAEYHYFDRRPLAEGVYEMDDATADAADMLEDRERHDEKLPLFVFVAAGSTAESKDGFDLLDVYGAGRVVIDAAYADPEIGDAVDVVVNPHLADAGEETTASALAAAVAAAVNPDVRADLEHLPAVSFWEDAPEAYADLAAEAGYEADAVREIREAVALEAYYQSYEDKRELVADLLFDDGGARRAEGPDGRRPRDDTDGLAAHISEQFRAKLEVELETAMANLERRAVSGVEFAVLDTDAFTHRYEFPPTDLLLDELHRRTRRDDPHVTIGIGVDELHVRSTAPLDVRAVAAAAREEAPNAGLTGRNARDGKLEFLSGEREAVLDAVVAAVADALA